MAYVLVSLPKGDRFYITKNRIFIGRDAENDIPASNPFASSRHCAIYLENNNYFLEDLASSNGTFVNSKRIDKPVLLKHKDIITLCPKGDVYQFQDSSKRQTRRRVLRLGAYIFVVTLFGLVIYAKFYADYLRKQHYQENISLLIENYGNTVIPGNADFKILLLDYALKIRGRADFDEIRQRRAACLPVIERIFQANGIPLYYSYLAWVESGFDNTVLNSRTGAGGMWQFMPKTAAHYGLVVSAALDERMNVEKSTQAAAEYLNDLMAMFGAESFPLVMAAYNAGEGRILYALKQIDNPKKERNFWYLQEKELIPAETREYVLKIISLMVINLVEDPKTVLEVTDDSEP